MPNQKFRFLTVKCPDFKATQALVERAKYDGSLYFVNWHKNQVQLFQRVKDAPENPSLDRTEENIKTAKQLTLNLNEA